MPKRISVSADESIGEINQRIENLNYGIAKCKFVKSVYPDVKVTIWKNPYGKDYFKFTSKTVNTNCSKHEVVNYYLELKLNLVSELEFNYNGESEVIKVFSDPEAFPLAKAGRYRRNGVRESYIVFYKFDKKDIILTDEILNDCKIKIMKFIKDHPGYKLDTKYLNPRLKKLLIFS